MFGLGFWEIAIILGIALIVLGPSKLPELAKGLGKGLREFRRATEDFKSTIEDEMNKPEQQAVRKQIPGEQAAQILPAQGTVPHDPHAHPPIESSPGTEMPAPAAPVQPQAAQHEAAQHEAAQPQAAQPQPPVDPSTPKA
jgi:TatA/E family protein of Tat protein translocase